VLRHHTNVIAGALALGKSVEVAANIIYLKGDLFGGTGLGSLEEKVL
jgi:hypothetical protein